MELLIYCIIPVIIGFVIQRYKFMPTPYFIVFIISVFVGYHLISCIIEGGSIYPDRFELILFISGIVICTLLFHMAKIFELKKKNKKPR